jgi:hypothetical protein
MGKPGFVNGFCRDVTGVDKEHACRYETGGDKHWVKVNGLRRYEARFLSVYIINPGEKTRSGVMQPRTSPEWYQARFFIHGKKTSP